MGIVHWILLVFQAFISKDPTVKNVQIIATIATTYTAVMSVLMVLTSKLKLLELKKSVFVWKGVVMAEDLKMIVMMETLMMEMAVQVNARLKMDGLVSEVHQV